MVVDDSFVKEEDCRMKLKFRAWDSVKKEMFKDTFAITESGQVVVVEQKFVTSSPDYIFVDHLVIMQSTGLKDKNGKEIFEGDVLTNGMDIVDVRNHETLGFYTLVNGREVFFGHGTSIEEFEENIEGFTEIAEVLGNVYENPELLEAIK